MRVYLDTAVLIYVVEDVAPFAALARRRLLAFRAEKITSDLSRMEAQVKPHRERDSAVLTAFDDYLALACAEVVGITRAVLDRATRLRADYPWLKTPDAIHLAAAIEAGCGVFLTNDRRLGRCAEEIAVETLAP